MIATGLLPADWTKNVCNNVRENIEICCLLVTTAH